MKNPPPPQKILHTGAVQIYFDPPLITFIKSKIDLKMERNDGKVKLRRNPIP